MSLFSIIIPTFNEEKYINKSIESIKNQTFKDIEIIIADNGSNDNTINLCNEADKVLICENPKNPCVVRNLGAFNSTGKYLAFLDADSTLSPNVLLNAKNYIENGYIGGRCKIIPPEKNCMAYIQTKILNNWAKYIAPQYTPFVFCTRQAFNKAGGWPENIELGNELILQRKLKKIGKLVYDNDSTVETSPRRYRKEGYLKVSLLGALAYFGFRIKWRYLNE